MANPDLLWQTDVVPADDRAVASARDKFLSHDAEPSGHVRRMILASWKRSRESDVDIDRIQIPYVRDPDLEAPLYRSAAPILDVLGEQLQSESVSIILTDSTGLVLDRRCSGSDITRQLDAVRLAPGFSYAEEFAGTNGIGTSLSSGRATLVDGREHYAQELGQFACAGAPIRHPTRGKVVGLLDLTAWSHTPGALLTALASSTAKQIEHELLAQTGLREFALFAEYLRTCQQSNGPVLALNNDVVMSNDLLRRLLDAPEQEALIGYAMDTMHSDAHEAMRTIELPSGRSAHLRYSPARCDSGPAGGVFRVRLGQPVGSLVPGARHSSRSNIPLRFPGVVGTGAVWRASIQQVESCYQAGDWVALEGEAGTGKRAVLRAVHRLHNPAGRFRVMEPPHPHAFDTWLTDLADEITASDAMIVLSQAERLDEEQVAAVSDLLAEATVNADHHARVAITIGAGASTPLCTTFPRTVEVPPLRHHIDDLPELVRHLLTKMPDGDRLTFSAQAMAQLSRLNWPGNVDQLLGVLTYVVKHRRTGTVEPADLPPECQSTSRRVLSPIEAMERDAIVTALSEKGASPTTAAKMLGMSRATIYRKIRHYGISLPLSR